MRGTRHKILITLCVSALVLIGAGCGSTKKGQKTIPVPQKSDLSITLTSAYDPLTTGLEPNKKQTVSFVIANEQKEIISQFKSNDEHIATLLIARSDLSSVDYIEPSFDPTIGQFSFVYTFNELGVYRLFANITPAEGHAEILSYDIMVGGLAAGTQKKLVPNKNPFDIVDGYVVRYNIDDNIRAGKKITYTLEVAKDGTPVSLEPLPDNMYQSLVLEAGTLSMIPIEKNSDNKLSFAATFPQQNTYLIATFFKSEGKIHFSRYIIPVKAK